ncbi:hypothetical protein GcM3_140002 [Golovinomyces cichoracearum]|uniref:Uncharacterized protein n=1 Tax=Golovinomyces cichoracearum TaxID=62708 RepID=A0A420I0M8_9PEZI|nr:hypothetical protein GcM3_140002 [Golovinomyces cichoracearum]
MFKWLKLSIDEITGDVFFNKYLEILAGFAEPDKYATAEREIEILVQRGSCPSFYSIFVAFIAQLGWTEDSVKIYYSHRSLKESLKDSLVGKDCPTIIPDSVALFIELKNQTVARRNENKISLQPSGQLLLINVF